MGLMSARSRCRLAALVAFLWAVAVSPPAAAEFGFSGMHVQGVDARIAKALGLGKPEGVMVMDVALGGLADFAGIKRGDRITKFNGVHIDTFKRLVQTVTKTKPGQTVAVKVQRAQGNHDFKLKFGSKPASWKVPKGSVINFPAIGITLAAIT